MRKLPRGHSTAERLYRADMYLRAGYNELEELRTSRHMAEFTRREQLDFYAARNRASLLHEWVSILRYQWRERLCAVIGGSPGGKSGP